MRLEGLVGCDRVDHLMISSMHSPHRPTYMIELRMAVPSLTDSPAACNEYRRIDFVQEMSSSNLKVLNCRGLYSKPRRRCF
jgi:hypothetical protein